MSLTFQEAFRAIFKRFYLVILGGIVVMVTAVIIAETRHDEEYLSESIIYVTPDPDYAEINPSSAMLEFIDSTIDNSLVLWSTESFFAKVYSDISGSDPALASTLSVTVLKNITKYEKIMRSGSPTVFVSVNVAHEDKECARIVNQAIVNHLDSHLKEKFSYMSAESIEGPTTPSAPVSSGVVKYGLLGFVIGGGAACVALVILQSVSPFADKAKRLSDISGAPILGELSGLLRGGKNED